MYYNNSAASEGQNLGLNPLPGTKRVQNEKEETQTKNEGSLGNTTKIILDSNGSTESRRRSIGSQAGTFPVATSLDKSPNPVPEKVSVRNKREGGTVGNAMQVFGTTEPGNKKADIGPLAGEQQLTPSLEKSLNSVPEQVSVCNKRELISTNTNNNKIKHECFEIE